MKNTVIVTITLPRPLADWVDSNCRRTGMSRSAFVRAALSRAGGADESEMEALVLPVGLKGRDPESEGRVAFGRPGPIDRAALGGGIPDKAYIVANPALCRLLAWHLLVDGGGRPLRRLADVKATAGEVLRLFPGYPGPWPHLVVTAALHGVGVDTWEKGMDNRRYGLREGLAPFWEAP